MEWVKWLVLVILVLMLISVVVLFVMNRIWLIKIDFTRRKYIKEKLKETSEEDGE